MKSISPRRVTETAEVQAESALYLLRDDVPATVG